MKTARVFRATFIALAFLAGPIALQETARAQAGLAVDVRYTEHLSGGCDTGFPHDQETVTGRFILQADISWPQLVQAIGSRAEVETDGPGAVTLTISGCGRPTQTFHGDGSGNPAAPRLEMRWDSDFQRTYVLIANFSLNASNTCDDGCAGGFSSSSALQATSSAITGTENNDHGSGDITITPAGLGMPQQQSSSPSASQPTQPNQPIQVSVPKVVDFNQPGMQQDGSHVLNFPETRPVLPPSSPGNASNSQMDSLLDVVSNIQPTGATSQAMAQSLTAALDQQLVGAGASSPSAAISIQPAQGIGQSSAQAAQELAQRLLDQGAQLLAPSDPLAEGATAIVGERLSDKLVDTLVDELDNLGVNQATLSDAATNALFQIDRAMNSFNLRKGSYEYTKGITDALTSALDFFFPPNQ